MSRRKLLALVSVALLVAIGVVTAVTWEGAPEELRALVGKPAAALLPAVPLLGGGSEESMRLRRDPDSFTGPGKAVPAPMPPPKPGAPNVAREGPSPGEPPSTGWSQLFQEERIIRNGSLSLTVTDIAAAIDRITEIVVGIPGAFIGSSNLRQEGERSSATMVITVPSASFDQALRRVRQIAERVNTIQVSSQDVTEQYIDLQSQLRHLKAVEERYLQLLGRAQRVEEILLLQDRLHNVQSQIERVQGRIRFLERRTDLSTITIQLLLPEAGKPSPKPVWDPVKTLERALESLLFTFRGVLDGAIYVLVYALPVLPFGLAFWLLWQRSSGRRISPTSLPSQGHPQ